MAYAPLLLACSNPMVTQVISMASERYLEQAHYLLAFNYSDGSSPHCHFGTSVAVMTLLAIAATSNSRHFDPMKDQAPMGHDKKRFLECVGQFIPWEHVTIRDDQHRPAKQRREFAAEELYKIFRNPLIHAGGVRGAWHLSGVIGNWYRAPQIAHVFPGLASWQEDEKAIAALCGLHSYAGQTLLEISAASSIIHTRPLYWCARKMVEAFAADTSVQQDIERNLSA